MPSVGDSNALRLWLLTANSRHDRYNDLLDTYESWQKQVVLQAEKELAHKTARAQSELAAKYDAALAEQTHKLMLLRAELAQAAGETQFGQAMLRAKEAQVQAAEQQVADLRSAETRHKMWRLCVMLLMFAIVVALALVLASYHVSYRRLAAEHQMLQVKYQELQAQLGQPTARRLRQQLAISMRELQMQTKGIRCDAEKFYY